MPKKVLRHAIFADGWVHRRTSERLCGQAIVASLAIALAACGGGGGSDAPIATPPPPSATVSGAVQKGPFIVGSTVTINVLNADGSNSSSTIVTQTTDNFGHFTFTQPIGTTVQISSTGFYRNEITGGVSSNGVTLRSVYSVAGAASQNAYVNVLTHLTSGRVLNLMVNSSLAIGAAIDRAETEFLTEFGRVVPSTGESDFSSISIYADQSVAGSPYLLAVSSIVYRYAIARGAVNGTNPDAELSLFLNELSADFASDGDIDMSLSEVRAAIPAIDPDAVMANVASWLGGAQNQPPTDINKYLDTDLDGLFNDVDTDDDNDGIADANDPAHYRPNDPIVISGVPPDRLRAGNSYAFTPAVVNNDHLSLAFSGTSVPAWATLDGATGRLSGTPTNEDAGLYTGIHITATSVSGPATLGPFSIEVITNPWASLTSTSTPRHSPATAVDNGSIYMIGGFATAGASTVVERYDVTTDTWHGLASMSVLRNQGATVNAVDGNLYLVGGENPGGEIAAVEVYSIATNSWSAASSMSVARSVHTSCVHGGLIYAFGGFTEDGDPGTSHGQSLASVERYDAALDTWVDRAPMPEQNWGMSCVTLGDRIYLFGGAGNSDGYRVYNPLADVWEASGTMPVGRRYGFGAVVLGGEIWLFGGYGTGTPQVLDSVDVFDPLTSNWANKTEIPEERYNAGVAVWNGMAYLLGGRSLSSNGVGSLLRYDPQLDPL